MRGFFAGSVSAQSIAPAAVVPRCGACGLFKACNSPKMPPSGQGRRRVLIVGDGPNKHEDENGQHFTGKHGQMLRDQLHKIGVDINRDCRMTNAIICHPGPKGPTGPQIGHCLPNLTKTIKEYDPDVIIPLGPEAVRAVIGPIWQEDPGSMQRWAGWRIPAQKLNAWVCPSYHPSYVDYEEDPVVNLWWGRHLAAAFELEGKPWATVPDYKQEIEIILDAKAAATAIREIIALGGPCAFDYETDRLKPDGLGAQIVCCSISWRGKRTIAYPWQGAAITATGDFLRSPLPKIASNAKFEDRWTRKVFGHRVRNWSWDTMIHAHVCDNRPGISSIKFQSFVRLGFPAYNKHIEPFLRSKGSRDVNQILREVDMNDLLRYNAYDSLLEYKVAIDQRRELAYAHG